MKRQRVYVDTSVYGGAFEKEFSEDSNVFFDDIQAEKFILVRSEVNELEILKAPVYVKDLYESIKANEFLIVTEEVESLQKAYLAAAVLTKKSYNDAMHVAVSTVAKIDCIVSWNFRHLVNFGRIKAFNAVNLSLGYSLIDIRSPKEMLLP